MSDTSVLKKTFFDFFWLFARFEYAMKDTGMSEGYLRTVDDDRADPNWSKLQKILGPKLESVETEDIKKAIAYLTNHPPMIQKVVKNVAEFQKTKFKSEGPGAQAIEAAKIVRNNLFHGGKCRPWSEQERDEELIQHSRIVLENCLKLDNHLDSSFRSITG